MTSKEARDHLICGRINCLNNADEDEKLRNLCIHALEAEPARHGHWDADADGYADGELVYDHWFCSECGWDDNGFLEEKPNYKYCPHCGAKMEDGK